MAARAPSGPLEPLAAPKEPDERMEPESERYELAAARIRATVVLQGQWLGTRGYEAALDVRVTSLAAATLERWTDVDDVSWAELQEEFRAENLENAARDSLRGGGLPAHVDGNGRFELDVTELLRGRDRLPTSLLVTLQHENFRSVRAEVPLVLNGERLSRAALEREGLIVLPFQWQLAPVCVVRGNTGLVDGHGAVHVEAWRLEGDRPRELLAEDDVDGPDDVFELPCTPSPKIAVVAYCDGYLPQTRVLYVGGELNLWIGRITLDRGCTYSGQVAVGEHTLGASAWLYLSRENPVFNSERFLWRGFVWFDNRFEPEAMAVRTSSDGSFRFTGLAGGLYELRMGIDPDWWTQMDPVYFVRAPDEGVTLRPWLTRIELQVEQGDLPASQRPIAVRGLGRDGASTARLVTDRVGRAELRLFPGEPYVVAVEQPRGPAWEYGKVTSRERLDAIERISMAAHASR
ncbi:MAG: hypothetical protein NTV21_05770 [Planctomycetota bacterium]|nr:hypothetical protein [Planctomycetota bacterium]